MIMIFHKYQYLISSQSEWIFNAEAHKKQGLKN